MTPIEWLLSDDTGISSMTICAVMTDSRYDDPNVPYDPHDFGRCHRLLQRFPAWRARLPEVAERYPAWGPMVAAWDELTAMYEAGERSRWDGERSMYRRMRQLIEADDTQALEIGPTEP